MTFHEFAIARRRAGQTRELGPSFANNARMVGELLVGHAREAGFGGLFSIGGLAGHGVL